MLNYYVFCREVNGRNYFSVGESIVPTGTRQVGSAFRTLAEALHYRDRHRDRRRAEALRVTLPLTTQPRACKRS
jgi:hypothetical protein